MFLSLGFVFGHVFVSCCYWRQQVLYVTLANLEESAAGSIGKLLRGEE